MHHPGQWHLDRTRGKLVYWPSEGEDISRIRVIAPITEAVIRLGEGTNNVKICGLGISVSTTPLVSGGFGAGRFDGAISGRNIHDCQFIDLRNERESAPFEMRDGSLAADPLFVNLENGDYALKPGSPALKLNILPINPQLAGRNK